MWRRGSESNSIEKEFFQNSLTSATTTPPPEANSLINAGSLRQLPEEIMAQPLDQWSRIGKEKQLSHVVLFLIQPLRNGQRYRIDCDNSRLTSRRGGIVSA